MIDRCCLYLLAEMSAEQAARFEQEAIHSDALRACLTQQAELIAALGTACLRPVPMPIATAALESEREVFLPQSSVDQPQPVSDRNVGGWLVGLAITLAASLLLLFGWDRPVQHKPESVQDAVQLAHAWAAARSEGASAESVATPAGAVDEGDRSTDPTDVAARPEGPPEWLIVAVRAAEANRTPTVETGEVDDG